MPDLVTWKQLKKDFLGIMGHKVVALHITTKNKADISLICLFISPKFLNFYYVPPDNTKWLKQSPCLQAVYVLNRTKILIFPGNKTKII